MHILSNISRSKGNQTKKFDQLIEYNLRNIFVETLYTKCAAETIVYLCTILYNNNLWINSVKS